ncbi:MAG: hypothetical protein H6710_18800 [Myxococcales bacterium]|nr:hypothetical protein [Myxococcales bacterium]MCB9706103.1 hypothetical protein [Myxococcales bacterium]
MDPRSRRRPNPTFIAFIFTVIGGLLLMITQRPELQPRPDRPAPAAAAVADVGAGVATLGSAYLAYAAVTYARRLAREEASVSASASVGEARRAKIGGAAAPANETGEGREPPRAA